MPKRSGKQSFTHCPKGHKLPHVTAFGNCTPVFCTAKSKKTLTEQLTPRPVPAKVARLKRAAEKQAVKALERAVRKQEFDANIDQLLPPGSEDDGIQLARTAANVEKVQHIRESGGAIGRWAARKTMLGAPPVRLEGADAEEYADRKIAGLLAVSADELEWQLLTGDDDQRMAAARTVLDATGRSKREAIGGSQPLVVVNMGGQQFTPPWAQQPIIVEGKVTDAPKQDGEAEGRQAEGRTSDDGGLRGALPSDAGR